MTVVVGCDDRRAPDRKSLAVSHVEAQHDGGDGANNDAEEQGPEEAGHEGYRLMAISRRTAGPEARGGEPNADGR
jgi:hypothetical protein